MEEELLVDTAATKSDLQDVCEADDECAGCLRGNVAEEEGNGAGDARGSKTGGDWDGRGWCDGGGGDAGGRNTFWGRPRGHNGHGGALSTCGAANRVTRTGREL